jgi:hypothetical protein
MPTPKQVIFGEFDKTDPNWLQSKITDPKITIPGGVRLAIASFNVAPYLQEDGRVFVPGGTAIARSYVDRANNTGYQLLTDALAVAVLADPTAYEVAVTLHDRWDIKDENHADGVQPRAGNLILENFLPNYPTLTANQLKVLRSNYQLILGRE